jgi:hypothetical protein
MRTLKIGHIELIPIEPNKSYFHCYSDLKDYLSELGSEYKFTLVDVSSYIVDEFSKLKIYRNFSDLYQVSVVTQIDVVTDDGNLVMIDDEDEIENFHKGKECYGFDEDGEESDVHMDSCQSFEDTGYYYCFIYRKI